MLFLQDLRGEIEKVATFLRKSLTRQELDKVADHLRFDNMAKNDSVNHEFGKLLGFMEKNNGTFIRKGKQANYSCIA